MYPVYNPKYSDMCRVYKPKIQRHVFRLQTLNTLRVRTCILSADPKDIDKNQSVEKLCGGETLRWRNSAVEKLCGGEILRWRNSAVEKLCGGETLR